MTAPVYSCTNDGDRRFDVLRVRYKPDVVTLARARRSDWRRAGFDLDGNELGQKEFVIPDSPQTRRKKKAGCCGGGKKQPLKTGLLDDDDDDIYAASPALLRLPLVTIPPRARDSWFPPMSWQVAYCFYCAEAHARDGEEAPHIGWLYT